MRRMAMVLGLLASGLVATNALADDPIGQIKTASGKVTIARGNAKADAKAGDEVFRSDIVTTAADSTAGITFDDNSLISLGPNTELALDQFQFDRKTHAGQFDANLRKGTLAVRSGQIVAERPEAMKIHTPAMGLAVRGTDFVVRAPEKN